MESCETFFLSGRYLWKDSPIGFFSAATFKTKLQKPKPPVAKKKVWSGFQTNSSHHKYVSHQWGFVALMLQITPTKKKTQDDNGKSPCLITNANASSNHFKSLCFHRHASFQGSNAGCHGCLTNAACRTSHHLSRCASVKPGKKFLLPNENRPTRSAKGSWGESNMLAVKKSRPTKYKKKEPHI